MNSGHVEKTNDRDYEVEERYGPKNEKGTGILRFSKGAVAKMLRFATGATVPWSLQQTGYKRKRRVTWTRYEVGKPLGVSDHGR